MLVDGGSESRLLMKMAEAAGHWVLTLHGVSGAGCYNL